MLWVCNKAGEKALKQEWERLRRYRELLDTTLFICTLLPNTYILEASKEYRRI